MTDATYKGQYTLLYFGFTHCPDICPSELVKVGDVVKELARRKTTPVKPLFISVDPHRDTIKQLQHYSQDFSNSFTFLTGTPDMVAKATKAYRVYFSKADEVEGDDEVPPVAILPRHRHRHFLLILARAYPLQPRLSLTHPFCLLLIPLHPFPGLLGGPFHRIVSRGPQR